MTKVTFLTFAAGKKCWLRSADRLARQAADSGLFDKIVSWTEEDLSRHNVSGLATIQALTRSFSKGSGLWSWKMPAIDYHLSRLDKGHLLLYLDSGFSINSNEKSKLRFSAYVDLAQRNGSVLFQQPLIEEEWSKNSLRKQFQEESIWQTGQYLGGVQLLSGTDRVRDFVRHARDLTLENGGTNLLEPREDEVQDSTFRHHRHDQSVISLAAKSHGMFGIPDETYFSPDWSTTGREFPLWATRLCSGNPNVENSLYQRGRRLLERSLPF